MTHMQVHNGVGSMSAQRAPPPQGPPPPAEDARAEAAPAEAATNAGVGMMMTNAGVAIEATVSDSDSTLPHDSDSDTDSDSVTKVYDCEPWTCAHTDCAQPELCNCFPSYPCPYLGNDLICLDCFQEYLRMVRQGLV